MKTTLAHSTPTSTPTVPSPESTPAAPLPAPNTGLALLVQELTAAIDSAEVALGPEPVVTTAKDRRRTGKPRKGSDKILTQLAPVAKQFKLESEALNTNTMLDRHQVAESLAPLQTRLQKISKRVDDEVFNARTDAWDMGLQFYSLMQRRAKTNGGIATAIAPLADSFAFRHPSKQHSKRETHAAATLRKSIALAEKHGISIRLGPNGEPIAVKGSPSAVQAAQAEIAASGSSPPPVATAPAAPAPLPAAPAPGVTGGASAAPVARS